MHDKIEAEGKELPFRKKKKLPQRSSGLAKTSGSTSKNFKKFKKTITDDEF